MNECLLTHHVNFGPAGSAGRTGFGRTRVLQRQFCARVRNLIPLCDANNIGETDTQHHYLSIHQQTYQILLVPHKSPATTCMDLKFIKKLSILAAIWLSLALAILISDTISKSTSAPISILYPLLIGLTFAGLKIWNSKLQDPFLDVNLTILETSISVLLAVSVAYFGFKLIQLDYMQSLVNSIILNFVITASQFTLLKSFQPDPASPTHGFNRVVALSKPIYFCMLAVLLLSCEAYDNYTNSGPKPRLVFYSFDLLDKPVIKSIGEASLTLILWFPVIFVLGLLPQFTTFIIHVLEQLDIHLFGSTASTLGFKSALFSFTRSLLAVILLYLVASYSFSLFCGLLVGLSYLLSRSTTNTTEFHRIIKRIQKKTGQQEKIELNELRSSSQTPIESRIESSIDEIFISRTKRDLIKCSFTILIVFALHISTIFTRYHEQIEKTFGLLAVFWGIIFHYVIPHLRRDLPFMCMAKPVLRPKEYNIFEVKTHAKLMWYEKVHDIALSFEKNFIYPIFWVNSISHDSVFIKETFGQHVGPLLLVIISMKLVRSSFNDSSPNYITIVFAYLFFNYDVAHGNYKIFTINYFVFSILHLKIHELLLKLQFIYIYIAPWQIPWGSAFHAFAQPFSVPHSALLFFQAVLSSILSAPLQPILGSAIFIMSYVRPVKFWERDYNTNVIDINSTRLVTQLERNRIDSNRLDGVFYEHLTKCLQRKLCKDLSIGRWGPVSQGDCFIMASDNLNCLVHIIEYGNGLCTFQLRGLEFRGTYCQQQEVEAITEGVPQDDGFCCCEPGHLPFFLSANAAFHQMWLAWHVTHTRYVLEGYSISDNMAGPMLQPIDLRRALITYYVKGIVYFAVTSHHLSKWLATAEFHDALEHTKRSTDADLDVTFSQSLDLDYDATLCGVTRDKFCSVYFDWIKYCFDRVKNDKNDTQRAKMLENLDCTPECFLVTLCYGLSLLARRSLSAAAVGQQFHTVESLLFGLHALLKGDFRVTSKHDEWIFQEMRFFKVVVIPAVRMSLKLHHDHFAAPEDYEENMILYEAIAGYQKNLVISHETDVAWRTAVLSGVPSLLTLRLYTDDGSNQYKFITLNRRFLSFRIIKINRECVRGLWASQQQELIYFRNTDPERGSIQNAKQALRNMINSSCDQPVGYPIYVSPLTTSYVECGSMSSSI